MFVFVIFLLIPASFLGLPTKPKRLRDVLQYALGNFEKQKLQLSPHVKFKLVISEVLPISAASNTTEKLSQSMKRRQIGKNLYAPEENEYLEYYAEPPKYSSEEQTDLPMYDEDNSALSNENDEKIRYIKKGELKRLGDGIRLRI